MEDGISETLHIASMGMDYTFKVAAGSAKLLVDFIRYVCNKAVLSQKEKAALQQMMKASCNACVSISTADVKDFEKLLNGHGVKYTKFTPITKSNKKPGITNFSFDLAQLNLMNTCLRGIHYAEYVDTSRASGDEKNVGASNRGNRAQNSGSGADRSMEDQEQTFDAYEFTSNYSPDELEFTIPKPDLVIAAIPVNEKINVVSPSVDGFSFMTGNKDSGSFDAVTRDRVPSKNIFDGVVEDKEDVPKEIPQHMDPPDLSVIDGIIARAKDKSEAIQKEKQAITSLVRDAVVAGVSAGKETLK